MSLSVPLCSFHPFPLLHSSYFLMSPFSLPHPSFPPLLTLVFPSLPMRPFFYLLVCSFFLPSACRSFLPLVSVPPSIFPPSLLSPASPYISPYVPLSLIPIPSIPRRDSLLPSSSYVPPPLTLCFIFPQPLSLSHSPYIPLSLFLPYVPPIILPFPLTYSLTTIIKSLSLFLLPDISIFGEIW